MQEQKHSWLPHLQAMTHFALARRERAPMLELAQAHRYLRVGGNGLRPVSIHPDNPCGSLYRANGSAIQEQPDIDAAISEAQAAQPRVDELGKNKTEHGVQAHLIHYAITRPGQLVALLKCQDLFDDLIFLADEFRLGAIRADVIALGKKGDRYFPVYVELKAGRELKRLIQQLDGIAERVMEAPEDALAFFAAATGVAMNDINLDIGRRVLIWPPSDNERAEVRAARERGYITIAFTGDSPESYEFTRVR